MWSFIWFSKVSLVSSNALQTLQLCNSFGVLGYGAAPGLVLEWSLLFGFLRTSRLDTSALSLFSTSISGVSSFDFLNWSLRLVISLILEVLSLDNSAFLSCSSRSLMSVASFEFSSCSVAVVQGCNVTVLHCFSDVAFQFFHVAVLQCYSFAILQCCSFAVSQCCSVAMFCFFFSFAVSLCISCRCGMQGQ